MTAAENEKPIELPWLGEPRFRCFGCSARNPIGLALRMVRLGDGRVATDVTFSEDYASYPGVVHGGIVAALVDELMGDAIALDRGMLAFSVTLRTKFLEPLLIGHPYRAVAEIIGAANGVVHAQADVISKDKAVKLMAGGTYQPISSAQAADHMGLAAEERARIGHYFDHTIG